MLFVLLYLGFRCVGRLLGCCGPAWGIRDIDDWASLPALLLLLSLFGFAGSVLGSAFSRYQESEADLYGLEVTHGVLADPGQASAQSYQRFGERVFIDPDPNPLGVVLFFDHPTISDRVRVAVTYDPWSHGQSPRFVK
jgi:Zn-dependent protease with chaperone function